MHTSHILWCSNWNCLTMTHLPLPSRHTDVYPSNLFCFPGEDAVITIQDKLTRKQIPTHYLLVSFSFHLNLHSFNRKDVPSASDIEGSLIWRLPLVFSYYFYFIVRISIVAMKHHDENANLERKVLFG